MKASHLALFTFGSPLNAQQVLSLNTFGLSERFVVVLHAVVAPVVFEEGVREYILTN